jgi:hypothetical protein
MRPDFGLDAGPVSPVLNPSSRAIGIASIGCWPGATCALGQVLVAHRRQRERVTEHRVRQVITDQACPVIKTAPWELTGSDWTPCCGASGHLQQRVRSIV